MSHKLKNLTLWEKTMSNRDFISFKLKMTPFAHPSDINWRNISNERRFIGVKRTFLFLISFLILIFITTPTVEKIILGTG